MVGSWSELASCTTRIWHSAIKLASRRWSELASCTTRIWHSAINGNLAWTNWGTWRIWGSIGVAEGNRKPTWGGGRGGGVTIGIIGRGRGGGGTIGIIGGEWRRGIKSSK